jgi:hypothetical protein
MTGPTPEVPKSDWESEKIRLEVKKLEIELKGYDDRVSLEQLKLRSDVKDWYYRLLVALVSTIVGVLTFVATQAYQRQSDDTKREIENIRDEDNRLRACLQQLADSNVAERISAAASLRSFIKPAVKVGGTHSMWNSLITPESEIRIDELERGEDESRSQEAIEALADRLLVESDVHAMEQDGQALIHSGTQALQQVARINRVAADDFARSTGRYLGESFRTKDAELCDNPGPRDDVLHQVDLLLARIQMPFESEFADSADATGNATAEIGHVRSSFKTDGVLLTYSLRNYFETSCHLYLESSKNKGKNSQVAPPITELVRTARSLATSSLILVRIYKPPACFQPSELPPPTGCMPISLNRVVVVNGLNSDVAFNYASLTDAYFQGVPANFACLFCVLSRADLRDLRLNGGGDLSGAELDGTHFRAPVGKEVKFDPIWQSKALQHLEQCREFGVHLDKSPTCRSDAKVRKGGMHVRTLDRCWELSWTESASLDRHMQEPFGRSQKLQRWR